MLSTTNRYYRSDLLAFFGVKIPAEEVSGIPGDF